MRELPSRVDWPLWGMLALLLAFSVALFLAIGW
jgi:hypothetical protein